MLRQNTAACLHAIVALTGTLILQSVGKNAHKTYVPARSSDVDVSIADDLILLSLRSRQHGLSKMTNTQRSRAIILASLAFLPSTIARIGSV